MPISPTKFSFTTNQTHMKLNINIFRFRVSVFEHLWFRISILLGLVKDFGGMPLEGSVRFC